MRIRRAKGVSKRRTENCRCPLPRNCPRTAMDGSPSRFEREGSNYGTHFSQAVFSASGICRSCALRVPDRCASGSVAIRKLASQITGHVITPEASDYESSRLVFNRAFDLRPALIVRCATSSDVALSRFCSEQEFAISGARRRPQPARVRDVRRRSGDRPFWNEASRGRRQQTRGSRGCRRARARPGQGHAAF